MGSNQCFDLMVVDELRHTVEFLVRRTAECGCVIADHGQILDTGFRDRVNEIVRSAAADKTAEHHGGFVLDEACGIFN